ncbi:hypothetical protein LUZ60_013672 [Juncus effusus]|nr:hypothetical protein LUZ60_013672 [Juncus effusus]
MERVWTDTLSWKIEFMKKRLSSLRDSSPESMKTYLLRLESVLISIGDRMLSGAVNRIVQKLEDCVDELENEVLASKYENSTSDPAPDYDVAHDPTCIASHKRICKAADSSSSDMEVHELIGNMDEVIENEQRLLVQGKHVVVPHEGELWESSAEEGNIVSTCLQKRKNSCEGLAISGSISSSDSTKQKANQIIDDLAAALSAFKLHSSDGKRQEQAPMVQEAFSVIAKGKIHGREKDVTNILKMLLSENDSNRSSAAISVLPVVGIGGLGKTILAKWIYSNEKVCHHFDLRGWHWVSQKFDLDKLMRGLIEDFGYTRCDVSDLSDLHSNLYTNVMGKNVFIVVEDVWDVSKKNWQLFLSSLQSAQSVRILVTTRSNEVAKLVQTMPAYSLGYLSPKDSWSMFKQVPRYRHIATSDDMIEIGRKIVNKCGGLPLAIQTIGRVLNSCLDIEFWREILQSEFWELVTENGEILPALLLSYINLPTNIKPCFVVFSLFPKGFEFSKDDVVRTWMSLNFLENENNIQPEEMGSIYFDKLIEQSLIQRNQFEKRQKCFLLNDLVHDLAQFVAHEGFSRIDAEISQSFVPNKGLIPNVRYLSVIVNDLPNTVNLQPSQYCERLRVLKIINMANKWNNHIRINILDKQFQNLKFLRVLDFSHTGIEVLPCSIENLRQLRYLNLTKTNIKKLPESISVLYNLQALELKDCPIQELPRGLMNLVNLRHLNFSDKNACIPRGIGALINLQTLPVFNIKRGSWHCHISELKGLVNLRGDLTITGLRNVSNVQSVKEANLRNKEHLQALTLDWKTGDHVKCNHSDFEVASASNEQCSEEEVLEWLQPNTGLKELHIHDYSGSRFPGWMGDTSFYRLSKITIIDCGENCEFLPTLGLLPSLKSLSIQWMNNIRRIGREFCSRNDVTKGFQSLETLELKYLPNLIEWVGVKNGEFIKLHTLRIVCCAQLQALPQGLSSSLTKLLISNCEKLSVLPSLLSVTRLALTGKLNDSLLQKLHLKSLRFLKIASSQSITCIPLNGDKLLSLEVLLIKGCTNLEYIVGIGSMTSLKRLEIVRCRWVQTSSSEEIPRLLQHLTVVRCPLLQEWCQEITVKYKNQLIKKGASACGEGVDDEMMVEDVRKEIDLDGEKKRIEAEKRSEDKTIQVRECSRSEQMCIEDCDEKLICKCVCEGSNMEVEQECMEAKKMQKGKDLQIGEGSSNSRKEVMYERDIPPMEGRGSECAANEFDEYWESLLMNNEM